VKRRGRPASPVRERTAESSPPLSARRAAWLLLSRPQDLADSERAALQQLDDICADVRVAHPLVQEFARLLRERRVEGLDPWLQQAATSGVTEVKRFAQGLRRDEAAVRAAFSLSYSSGQIEGQVNKLKLLKRSMYGRAKLDLLRRRTLATGTC
jgi:transposase